MSHSPSVTNDFRPKYSRWLWPALVFCILTALVFWLARWQENLQSLELEAAASIDSAANITNLRERLKLHAQFLRSLKAFAAANLVPADNLQAWQRYADEVDVGHNLPGLLAFAYAPAIHRHQVDALVARIKEQANNPDFNIKPSGNDDKIVPLVFIAPNGVVQKQALGFNLLSDNAHREVIEAAVVSQDVALSGPLVRVFDKETQRPGFVLAQAIFHHDLPTRTIAERRLALAGIVMMGYRVDDFIDALKSSFANRFALQVFDDGNADRSVDRPPELIYDSHPSLPATADNHIMHRELDFGGRNWILKFRELPYSGISGTIDRPRLIVITGLLGNILIALLIFYLTTHRERAEHYSHKLTGKLARSEERFRLAARGTNDGLWDQNLVTGEDYLSARVGEILNLPSNEAPQNSVEFIARVHPDDESKRRAALGKHFHEQAPYDVELRVRNQAQEWSWIRLRGEAVRDANGRVTRMAGSISDITELRRAQAELLEHRDHLQELVAQRTARLDQALLEARAATIAKSEFLANMSHELRTPMHAILSFSELGQRRSIAGTDEKIPVFFSRIAQSADRLLHLIDDLLDLSKLEAGRMEMSYGKTSLPALIHGVHNQLESLMQQRGLRLELESCPEAEQICIDSKRIEQVVHNLLANAIKFSPNNGEIRISMSSTQLPRGRRANDDGFLPAICVQITDDGPGIPHDELESIFGKFTQSSATNTGAGGTGLGLAICQEIVTRHRGTISAANNTSGGACFTITLPTSCGQELK
ncbi:MAG: CHASE domain-containing protein [Rhodocyclaceae bacterium]|nr:CHASE domain-containing protein [Rhodocyclaceae bacterium]